MDKWWLSYKGEQPTVDNLPTRPCASYIERARKAEAEADRLRAELERAAEVRENANAVSLRLEGELERVRAATLREVAERLQHDDTDLAMDLEFWAEADLAGGSHSLEIDAHVAASAIRKKLATLIEREFGALATTEGTEG